MLCRKVSNVGKLSIQGWRFVSQSVMNLLTLPKPCLVSLIVVIHVKSQPRMLWWLQDHSPQKSLLNAVLMSSNVFKTSDTFVVVWGYENMGREVLLKGYEIYRSCAHNGHVWIISKTGCTLCRLTLREFVWKLLLCVEGSTSINSLSL